MQAVAHSWELCTLDITCTTYDICSDTCTTDLSTYAIGGILHTSHCLCHIPCVCPTAEHQLAKQPVDIEGADLQLVERALKKVSGETVFEMTEIFLGDHHAGKDRRKRNTKKYHLEVMLVADNMLFSRRKFRDNTHAGNYMLAIANLVSVLRCTVLTAVYGLMQSSSNRASHDSVAMVLTSHIPS